MAASGWHYRKTLGNVPSFFFVPTVVAPTKTSGKRSTRSRRSAKVGQIKNPDFPLCASSKGGDNAISKSIHAQRCRKNVDDPMLANGCLALCL